MGNQDVIDNMLSDMRSHVSSLQSKLSVADAAVSKSQTVNDKIVIMKEYQDKVSTMNSCWRSKNRKGLVANLQHENRQMLALEEENRRLRFALKEMEEGLQLIMADYRRIISGFSRFDVVFNFARKHFNNNPGGCIEHEKFMALAAAVNDCISVAEDRMIEQEEIIAELRTENETLRELAYYRPKLHFTTAKTKATLHNEKNIDDQNEKTTDKFTPTKSLEPNNQKRKDEDDEDSFACFLNNKKSTTLEGTPVIYPKEKPKHSYKDTVMYSWPCHVDREKLKCSDLNTDMGETNSTKIRSKAQLPRENPGRRNAFSPKSSVASGSGSGSFTVMNMPSSTMINPPSETKTADASAGDTNWTTVPPEKSAADQSLPPVKGEKTSSSKSLNSGNSFPLENSAESSSKISPAKASNSTITTSTPPV